MLRYRPTSGDLTRPLPIPQNLRMGILIRELEARLEALPVPVALQLPGGTRVGAAAAAVTLFFKNRASLARLAAGQIGRLAEDLVESRVQFEGRMRDLMAAAAHLLQGSPVDAHAGLWRQLAGRVRSLAAHTQPKDASQIQFHYDVSDDFYALWLDPRRVYSCAYFRAPELTLAQAQEAKLDHICRKLMLRPGERFLDIGAGWGALLLWAAEHYGVQATGITLSRNQHAHVHRLIAKKGLQGQVRMELLDYRALHDEEGFDKIASVGMFEHVGQARMPEYFARIYRLLKPGGLVMNHGITTGGVHAGQLGAGMGDFIDKYIFPGGELLPIGHVLKDLGAAGLEMVDTENLRPHYARTLWCWSDALEAQLDEAQHVLEANGHLDDAGKVLRAYRLYLSGCAMCFEQGWISLHQILATRPDGEPRTGAMRGAQSGYPFNREYIYR